TSPALVVTEAEQPTPVPSPPVPTPVVEPTPAPTAMVSAVEDVQELTPTPAAQSTAVAPLPQPAALAPSTDPACDDTARPDPLPAPGSARAQDFFRSFRTPLAPAPLYDPPGPRRVGLQAGHWQNDQVPPELGRLQAGAVGGGKQEWQVNVDVAQRTAALLQVSGVEVDVLPATVPPRYRHAVAPGVPQAIIEMGYLTSAADRQLLIGDPDRLARGVANSIQAFLSTLP